MADALRMPHRIGDRDRAALRNAEQGEALEAGRFDHTFEVAHEASNEKSCTSQSDRPLPRAS